VTEVTERRIEFKELNRMIVACKLCSAEVTIDISNQKQFEAIMAKRSQLACPVCDTEFDSSLPDAIGAFAIWHDRLFKAGHRVFFRVAQ
jgi:hypothetical protein